MKKLLNTLFVTTEDAYLSLDGENVVVSREKQELARRITVCCCSAPPRLTSVRAITRASGGTRSSR